MPGVVLMSAGTASRTTATSSTGTYSLTGLPRGDYVVIPSKSGDVNGINAQDIGLVRRLAAGINTATPCTAVSG